MILVAAMLTLLAVSCNRKVEYDYQTFATLYTTSYITNDGAGEIEIPVILYNSTGSDSQVLVKLIEGKAEINTDITLISPASGYLVFSGDTDTLMVKVGITSYEGELTGSKDFSVQISSVSPETTVGNVNTAKVTINDLDHPLYPYFGSWSGSTFEEAYTEKMQDVKFDIAEYPGDYTKLLLTTIDPMMSSIVGYTAPIQLYANAVLNSDGTGQVVIPQGQATGFEYSYGPWVYMGVDAPSFNDASSYTDIVFNLNADGTMTVPNAYGLFDDQYIWASYVGGFNLTKK